MISLWLALQCLGLVYIVSLSWKLNNPEKHIIYVYLYHVLPIVLLSVYGYGTLLWSECLCLECPPMHISYSVINVPRCCYVSQWTKIMNYFWKLLGKIMFWFLSAREFNPIKPGICGIYFLLFIRMELEF